MDDQHAPARPHGPLEEVLDGVHNVTGTHKWHFQDLDWQFSRNMTVVRDGNALTLINALRLNAAGLAALEALGQVRNVVQIGGLHGIDDAFYVARYGAAYWAQPGAGHPGVPVTRELVPEGTMPVGDSTLFRFETTKIPECILRVDRAGGILIACDALQNYLAPDAFFSEQSAEVMDQMGFFTPANVGPVWMQAAEPEAGDFRRLLEVEFRHVLCAHGEPVLDGAHDAFARTFNRLFDI